MSEQMEVMEAKGAKKIIITDKRTRGIDEKRQENKKIEEERQLLEAQRLMAEAQRITSIAEDKEKKVDLKKCENIDRFRLSFIEDYEEEEAKKLIEEQLGFEAPRVAGYRMAVKIHIRPEDMVEFTRNDGTKGAIVMPKSMNAHDKFTQCTALVLNQGSTCYTTSAYRESWFITLCRKLFNKWMPPRTKFPLCKVGDWIVIPRNEGIQVNYRGIPVQYIYEDVVCGVVQDPSWVTRD